MKSVQQLYCTILVLAAALTPQMGLAQRKQRSVPRAPGYEMRRIHDPNGIGKFFMGREIAHVMGHQAADWLERPEREEEERPSLLLDLLNLKPGQVIADIGAGSGYLSFPIAQKLGPTGKVMAVDVQPEMLEIIRKRSAEKKISNVVPILGEEKDPKLPPGSVDLIVMVDVYHEFSYPWEMGQAMVRSLKPGGRIAFVEYRMEDPTVPIKLVHKMSEAQVKKEMAIHPGMSWERTLRDLPRQHVIFFRKAGGAR